MGSDYLGMVRIGPEFNAKTRGIAKAQRMEPKGQNHGGNYLQISQKVAMGTKN